MSNPTSLDLKFVYPAAKYHQDIRTVTIYKHDSVTQETSEIYRVRVPITTRRSYLTNVSLPQFEHPSSGMAIGVTVFSKKNPETGEWDRIGHIEWTSPLSGAVTIDGNEVRFSWSILTQRVAHATPHTGYYQGVPKSYQQDEHVRPATPTTGIKNLMPPAGHVGSDTKASNTNGKPATTSRTIYM